jgi:hypothetical protein
VDAVQLALVSQILDRFHAKEDLSKVGKIIYRDSKQGKKWIQRRYDELDEGRLKSLLKALECADYIRNNRHRMNYPEFHQQGLCTSTGVVEAGCKVVIGTRLKRAGMHWTVSGKNAIIALRCSKLSGRNEDFWERRLQRGRLIHPPNPMCTLKHPAPIQKRF